MTSSLTAERVRELFVFDPETGVLRNRKARCSTAPAGAVAGVLRKGALPKNDYRRVEVGGVRYYEHRLIWLYVFGVWPTAQIDHRDGDRHNNRLSNLREADQTINSQNQHRAHSRNVSGLLGVSPSKKQFRARIEINGKTYCLGTFPNRELAHRAYVNAKRQLHACSTL